MKPWSNYVGEEVDGRWRLTSMLGVGCFGAVYAAESVYSEPRAAIRLLPPQLGGSSTFDSSVLTEFRHPNAVEVNHVGEFEGTRYLVMPLIRMSPLRFTRKPWPGYEVLEFVRQVGRALIALEERFDLQHLHLHPNNIFVEDAPGQKPRFLLADWGLGSQVGASALLLEGIHRRLTSPENTPPEQLQGLPPSRQSDVFGFGVLLLVLLTGSTPCPYHMVPLEMPLSRYTAFVSNVRLRLFRDVSEEQIADPRIRSLLLSCLSESPTARPHSIRELVCRFVQNYHDFETRTQSWFIPPYRDPDSPDDRSDDEDLINPEPDDDLIRADRVAPPDWESRIIGEIAAQRTRYHALSTADSDPSGTSLASDSKYGETRVPQEPPTGNDFPCTLSSEAIECRLSPLELMKQQAAAKKAAAAGEQPAPGAEQPAAAEPEKKLSPLELPKQQAAAKTAAAAGEQPAAAKKLSPLEAARQHAGKTASSRDPGVPCSLGPNLDSDSTNAPQYLDTQVVPRSSESLPKSLCRGMAPTTGIFARLGNMLRGIGRTTLMELPIPITDQVHFTITAPATLLSGKTYIIDVWAHVAAQRKEVIERAQEAQRGRGISIRSKGGVTVARATLMTLKLQIPRFLVDDPQDKIVWDGNIGNATFPFQVPHETLPDSYHGTLSIHVDGLEIAKLHFDLIVGMLETPTQPIAVQEKRHRTAFASYASDDRDDVLARIQGIQKVVPELKVFLDVASLRSGQRWEEQLEKEIADRDVFYLFWSAHAQKSVWVEREWRMALARRGIDYIDPIPLISPDEVPPPEELARELHFNDWVLAYMRGTKR